MSAVALVDDRRRREPIQLELFRPVPTCAGCHRPESEAGPFTHLVERGPFCAGCEREARRWPA